MIQPRSKACAISVGKRGNLCFRRCTTTHSQHMGLRFCILDSMNGQSWIRPHILGHYIYVCKCVLVVFKYDPDNTGLHAEKLFDCYSRTLDYYWEAYHDELSYFKCRKEKKRFIIVCIVPCPDHEMMEFFGPMIWIVKLGICSISI